MDELRELLAALGDDFAALAELDDQALAESLEAIRAEIARLREAGEASDEFIEVAEVAAAAVEAITAEQTGRDTAANVRAERAAALAERILGQAPEEGEDGDGEADVPAQVEEPEQVEHDEEEQPVAVAAAAPAPTPRGGVRATARRPAGMEPSTARVRSRPQLSLVASANNPFAPQGVTLTEDTLIRSLIASLETMTTYRGPRTKMTVAQLGLGHAQEMYGEDRTLRHESAESNYVKIRNVTAQRAITAAGGICAPPVVRYDLPNLLGTTARPVRDALTRFGADRGSVTALSPIVLDDVSAGVSTWTNTTDTTPGGSTKPCVSMTCPSPTTVVVDAIVQCLQVGNFRARFFAEQIREWLDHLDVWHSRYAERALINTIGAASKHIVTGQLLGTTKDILTVLDREVSNWRSRYRLPDTFRFRWMAPRWLRDQMRADLVRELPNGTTDERFAVADSSIERWISSRGINVTWMLDGETGQEFSTQGGTTTGGVALNPFKTTVVHYLFPEGSWLFLDAAGFDFGIVRDSTLNAVNNYRIMSETFEAAMFFGVESHRIASTVCPDGSTSSTLDINPCTTGS